MNGRPSAAEAAESPRSRQVVVMLARSMCRQTHELSWIGAHASKARPSGGQTDVQDAISSTADPVHTALVRANTDLVWR